MNGGQFSQGQRSDAIELIEDLPWGEIESRLRAMEDALARALDATGADLARWEEQIRPALELADSDEFTLTDGQIAAMTPEQRLAYVARLLQSLAVSYGLRPDPAGGAPAMLTHDSESPAALLRGLNDLVCLPVETPV